VKQKEIVSEEFEIDSVDSVSDLNFWFFWFRMLLLKNYLLVY